MRFLLDQDVYPATAGLSRAGDMELLQATREQSRILVTRDKDLGGLVSWRSNRNP